MCDESPTYLRNKTEGTTRIIGRFVFLETACTNADFPHPNI